MTPRLSGNFSIFGLVFFVLKSLLGIARQRSREKFATLTLKHRNHVRILVYRTGVIDDIIWPKNDVMVKNGTWQPMWTRPKWHCRQNCVHSRFVRHNGCRLAIESGFYFIPFFSLFQMTRPWKRNAKTNLRDFRGWYWQWTTLYIQTFKCQRRHFQCIISGKPFSVFILPPVTSDSRLKIAENAFSAISNS